VDDPEVVLEAALRFLEARQRSIHEVRRRLGSAGYRPELIGGAIERLVALGIVDDEEFARSWVESRDRAHPRGERALRRELALKGIDRAIADAVLAERGETAGGETAANALDADAGHAADLGAAERLLEKNGRTLDRIVDPRQRRQRGYALLARHGFDPDVARDALRGLEAATDAVDEEDRGADA
jgi:regulatory protein